MESLTVNAINILLLISLTADLISIAGFVRAILSRNYSRFLFKVLLIISLFGTSLLLFHASRVNVNVQDIFDVDLAVYLAGIAYFLLSAFTLLAVSYITFSTRYTGGDYAFFVIAILVPYLLGMVLHGMLFKLYEFIPLSVVFLYIGIIEGILMSKNYILNLIHRAADAPVIYGNPGSQSTVHRFLDGKTKIGENSIAYFLQETMLMILAFTLGIFVLAMNNTAYSRNLAEFWARFGNLIGL